MRQDLDDTTDVFDFGLLNKLQALAANKRVQNRAALDGNRQVEPVNGDIVQERRFASQALRQ